MIKTFLCVAMLAMGWQQARGYALLGPLTSMAGLPSTYGDTWEIPTIGYDLAGDVGTPKNIGQGYRHNITTNYYAFDENFADYFGVQGEQAVVSAMNVLNNTFTNNSLASLDGYSAALTEFPFDSQSVNYTAQSLALTDLKSEILAAMMEQLGLAEPERYVWTLHDRYLPPTGVCPADELYTVVQRNYYDQPTPLTQVQYSPYVNNTLYSYEITEECTGPNPLAVTVPFAVDPEAETFTAVAGLGVGLGVTEITAPDLEWASPEVGGYYTGLTRDDVAGLRYLMTSNNIVFEDPGLGSMLEATNFNTLNLLETSDLYALLQFAQTNAPATLQAAFPTLEINTVSNYFTLGSNPIVTAFLENAGYGSPAGATVMVVQTNGWTFFPITNYSYTFGNIVYVHYHTNTPVQVQTISVQPLIGGVAGSFTTNVSYQTILESNVVSGDYYLIPPGSCGLDIVATLLTNNFASSATNVIATATNETVDPGFVDTVSIVTHFTNDWFEYYSCNFQTSTPAFYQGIGHMQFVRVPDNNYDSLTQVFYSPITNTYSMIWYDPTNSQIGSRTFQRILTQPDYLFSARDLASPNPPVAEIGIGLYTRNVDFDINNILPNLAGPGTINPPTVITLNEVGDIFGNGSIAENEFLGFSFLSQLTQGSLLAWASFDGTTNDPVVYPNGTSIQELENQLIITVTPPTLPAGTNDVAFPTTRFSATGGQPPYTWSLNGTQLPTGLAFYGGVLSGTPVDNSPGVYDFTIQLTDADNRVVDLPYSIDIIY
jgi:hypothetical protein